MAAPPVEQQISQLNDARKLVLGDATYYPTIIQGILPIAGPGAKVELRRWVADFLAETFASPTLSAGNKETLSLVVLDTLKGLIETNGEDAAVVKSVVQTAASVYPLVFRWIINNPHDTPTWERMLAIKSRILRIWDTAAPGVRICCIKFAQRVVLVQTKGPDADPKRGDPLEVSLTMVPSEHKVIPPKSLEAEASGLLDRMLAVFQENVSDAVLVDATLNSLSILIRARPHIANKILNVILNFNPLKQANSPMTSKIRVMVKSMEKTTRMLLVHILKRDPGNPLAPRIQQYVERMMRSKSDIFDEAPRKRGPPEPTDMESAKRQKLAQATTAPKFYVPPLTPGPHSIAELYTINPAEGIKGFDVAMIPEAMVVTIAIKILQTLDAVTLNEAIEGVRQRYKSLEAIQPEFLNPETAPLGVDEDDDDYEPDFTTAETDEQILNKLDLAPPEVEKVAPDMALGRFALPQPLPLTTIQAAEIGQGTVTRVFGVMQTLEEKIKKPKGGLNRLAASAFDRDAWITIITRLATRTSAGLEGLEEVKPEPESPTPISLSNTIRESLYQYILQDFRKRIEIAVAWLCEEWYNDRIQMKSGEDAVLHYEKWVLKILDGMVPFLNGDDRKTLIKFISEIPGLSVEVLGRLKDLCRDPSTVSIALQTLLFLVLVKQPSRQLVFEVVEDIWDTYEDARPMATKLFSKHMPGLEQRLKDADEEKKSNGHEIENGTVSAGEAIAA